jgi:DNA-directed RNA polymerase subunit F
MAYDLPADLLALKNELTTDPKSLGLTLLAADDEANANKLNEVRSQTPIDREAIPVSEIVLAVDADEYLGLSMGQQLYLNFITNAGVINPKAGNEVREALLQFFSAASETRQKLLALIPESASRVNQLFKAGTLSKGGNVTPSDIANARVA